MIIYPCSVLIPLGHKACAGKCKKKLKNREIEESSNEIVHVFKYLQGKGNITEFLTKPGMKWKKHRLVKAIIKFSSRGLFVFNLLGLLSGNDLSAGLWYRSPLKSAFPKQSENKTLKSSWSFVCARVISRIKSPILGVTPLLGQLLLQLSKRCTNSNQGMVLCWKHHSEKEILFVPQIYLEYEQNGVAMQNIICVYKQIYLSTLGCTSGEFHQPRRWSEPKFGAWMSCARAARWYFGVCRALSRAAQTRGHLTLCRVWCSEMLSAFLH